jgi:hypothetical protein
VIDQTPARGWSTQLHNQPLIQAAVQKTWRVSTGSIGDLETDVLPQAMAAVGLRRIYGVAGSVFRIGQGLDADYGPARVRPGLTSTDVFRPTQGRRDAGTQDISWYLFAGAAGQTVA